MSSVGRAVAVCFLLLAAYSGFLYVQSSVNHVWATEAAVLLPENIEVAGVRIYPARTPTAAAYAEVLVNVTNRGNVAVSIITLEFELFMDNPTDPRELGERLGDERIGSGSLSMPRSSAPSVPPHQTRALQVRVGVSPGSSEYDVFNTTVGGLYFPVVLITKVVMSYPDFDVIRTFLPEDPFFYPVGGVRPAG